MTTPGLGTRALPRRQASLERRRVMCEGSTPGCVAKRTEPTSRSDQFKVRANAGLGCLTPSPGFFRSQRHCPVNSKEVCFCQNKVLQHKLNIECCSKAWVVIRIIL